MELAVGSVHDWVGIEAVEGVAVARGVRVCGGLGKGASRAKEEGDLKDTKTIVSSKYRSYH